MLTAAPAGAPAATGYPGVLENDTLPAISGDVAVGGTAVVSPGDWSGPGADRLWVPVAGLQPGVYEHRGRDSAARYLFSSPIRWDGLGGYDPVIGSGQVDLRTAAQP